MREVVIAGAVRTAIGKYGGTLVDVPVAQMGKIVIQEAMKKAGVPAESIEEVIMGNVLQAGQGQGTARQSAIYAGIPHSTPAATINKICGSGLKAVNMAASEILSGNLDIAVAGGMENMSNSPYLIDRARWGLRMGDSKLHDCMIKDGLWDAFHDYHMGITAENVVEKYKITRAEQDEFSLRSQMKASEAVRTNRFTDEIVPVEIPQRKGAPIVFDQDESPRANTTLEGLKKLRPAFKPDGTVTAGNSSGISDGAAAMVVLSGEKAKEYGVKPMAKIISYASAGVNPEIMGTGPVGATKKALNKAGLSLNDIQLVEANEAFAAQSIAVGRELQWDMEKVNVNGGAIALGHPIGASGARILVTLLYEMIKRDLELGLATLCIGGGMGISCIVQRV